MTAFYMTPYEPSEWRKAKSDLNIHPDIYKKKMLERWPETEFFSTSPHASLQWMINIRDENESGVRGTIGMLHNDLQVVSCDTPFEEFFLWHRSVVPSQYRLYLFNDSSLERFVELRPDTSLAEIARFVGGRPK